jgi:hypothetical protein
MKITLILSAAALAGLLTIAQSAQAQRRPPPAPTGPPPPAQKAAAIDLTGYWVTVVTEDWRWRMLTPPHGDYASVPLNPAGKKLADTFDAAQYGGRSDSQVIDCRAYYAAGLMRMPTRVHITWANDETLKLESDWGEQTRMFYFKKSDMPQSGPTPQGSSFAVWQRPQIAGGGGFGFRRGPPPPANKLYVVTDNLVPGWLRRNGVPYGSKTHMEEWYQIYHDPTGKEWFDVTTKVEDPEYLMAPFITSDDFRKEPDGSKWAPHPCKG